MEPTGDTFAMQTFADFEGTITHVRELHAKLYKLVDERMAELKK